jgi:hypothetical protein
MTGLRVLLLEAHVVVRQRTLVGVLALWSLAAGPAATAPVGPVPAGERACELSDADRRWVQRALQGWELVRRDILKLDERSLPWIVLYDSSCTWEIAPTAPPLADTSRLLSRPLTFAGGDLAVRATPHHGTVLLPNRIEIPIEVKASTQLYRSDRLAFLVMAMPSVWRADRQHASKPFLDEFLQGAFVHELTHTRHLVTINRRLRRLIRTHDVPGRLTDDVIQMRFGKQRGFAKAIERERDLLYRAAAASDADNRRELVTNALAVKRERHARYFTGGHAVYAEIEGLFLAMEGTAQWAAYRLIETRGTARGPALNLVRDNRRYWSQDQGLALFVLLDAMVPGWQARMFEPLAPSPFTLLEEAIEQGA